MPDNMEENNQSNTGVSDDGEDTQVNAKTFTKDEVNAFVARRVAAVEKKYDGFDVEEYKTLKASKDQAEQTRLLKREEFDKILKQTKEKSDQTIAVLQGELTKVRVDGALVSAAGKLKATNPEHVAKLLRANVKLDDAGLTVVTDDNGQVRYNTDTAEQFTIENLVDEFINANPYFRSAGKPGTGSLGNTDTKVEKDFDLSQLDLTRPEDREVYKKMKVEGKV